MLDAVMKWALDSKVTNVLVLEGIPMQGIPQSKRSPFVVSNSEDTHTLINDLDMSDSNARQSDERSQAEISNESLTEYHDTSDSIGPTYIGGISGGLLYS